NYGILKENCTDCHSIYSIQGSQRKRSKKFFSFYSKSKDETAAKGSGLANNFLERYNRSMNEKFVRARPISFAFVQSLKDEFSFY
ncbi:hypothetical protein MXB_4304, partial [Myxobolus squamalis]